MGGVVKVVLPLEQTKAVTVRNPRLNGVSQWDVTTSKSCDVWPTWFVNGQLRKREKKAKKLSVNHGDKAGRPPCRGRDHLLNREGERLLLSRSFLVSKCYSSLLVKCHMRRRHCCATHHSANDSGALARCIRSCIKQYDSFMTHLLYFEQINTVWRFWALSVLKGLQLLNRWSRLFVPAQGFDANQFLLLVTVTLCLTGVSYGRQTPVSAYEEITTLTCVCKLIFTWPQLCHSQGDANKALISPEAALTGHKTLLNHMTSSAQADGGKTTTNRSRERVWEREWNGKKELTATTEWKPIGM